MSLVRSLKDVENHAPDQRSLAAAFKLSKANRWSALHVTADKTIAWGACQGSGSTPYECVVDLTDGGAKCSCPSRKFPCKHALSLMMEWVNRPADFTPASVEQWITEWMGRRRKTTPAPAEKTDNTPKKTASLIEAQAQAAAEAAKEQAQLTPEEQAKKEARAEAQKAQTLQSQLDGAQLFETWLADQMQGGLQNLLGQLSDQCRAMSARLADYKAQALSSRLDELPAQIMAAPKAHQLDILVVQLSEMLLVTRAFQRDPTDPEIRRQVGYSNTRDDILADPASLSVSGWWQMLREDITTLRNNLVQQKRWFL
ncbi:MAG: SWIM zinc finger family protein, partial [Pseudomonadota bacterium]